jgi:crotonobetainyl-CoA:carnitine CoA-transferase CaiB-like acyl-CoA transferase
MNAHAAVLEALIGRGLHGAGTRIEVSLFDGMADWMNVPLLFYEGTGQAPRRLGLAHPSICPYGAFATSDGHLVLISIQNEREWAQFCAVFLEEPELPLAEGYQTNNSRVANRALVDANVARGFARLDRDAAAARLRQANTAYGFVNEIADLARHPALRRATVATPNGPASLIAPPALLDGAVRALGAVPALGAHTTALRAEFG